MGTTGLLFRGQRERRAGRPADALATLDRAAALAPDSPHVALHRALAQADAGQLDAALDALARSASRWPSNAVFPLFRGLLLAESGRLDEAAPALAGARKLSPQNLLLEACEALAAMRRGDVVPALRRLGAAGLTDNPRALAAILVEVEAELLRRLGPQADAAPPKPEPLPPPDDRLRRLSARRLAALGLARLEKEDPARAWPLLLLAVEKNPSLPDLFAHLGFAAFDLGRYEEALDYLARVGPWSPSLDAVYLHRGACLYRLGRFAEAAESLEAAEKADALGNFTAWIQLFLGRTLVALGRAREARVCFRKLVEIEGDLAIARLRQARELLGLDVPDSAPRGYEAIAEGKTVTVVKPPFADALRDRRPALPPAHCRLPTADCPLPTVPAGRAPMQRIALPDGGTALVRQCRRGGLLARLLGDKHLDGNRFLREIAVSDALRRRGIPTPEIIAGIRRETFPGIYRAEIVSREVPDSLDLAAALRAAPSDGGQPPDSGHASRTTHHASPDSSLPTADRPLPTVLHGSDSPISPHAARGTRHAVLAAAAVLLRQMHDAGLYHADLNAKNILLAPDGTAMILDLDRAELLDRLSLRDRAANLARLYRSLHKLGLAPEPASDADWAEFYRVYAGDDARLRAHTNAVMTRCHRELRRHRLWWRLFGR